MTNSGDWSFTIWGSGLHHNKEQPTTDVDVLVKRLVNDLRVSGQIILGGTFTSDGPQQVDIIARAAIDPLSPNTPNDPEAVLAQAEAQVVRLKSETLNAAETHLETLRTERDTRRRRVDPATGLPYTGGRYPGGQSGHSGVDPATGAPYQGYPGANYPGGYAGTGTPNPSPAGTGYPGNYSSGNPGGYPADQHPVNPAGQPYLPGSSGYPAGAPGQTLPAGANYPAGSNYVTDGPNPPPGMTYQPGAAYPTGNPQHVPGQPGYPGSGTTYRDSTGALARNPDGSLVGRNDTLTERERANLNADDRAQTEQTTGERADAAARAASVKPSGSKR